MKELLKELYYIETAKNAVQLSDRQNQEYENERKAYDAFFNTLTDEQKTLYLAYEELHGIIRCEENENLYRRAFSSGFSLAQELLEQKNKTTR